MTSDNLLLPIQVHWQTAPCSLLSQHHSTSSHTHPYPSTSIFPSEDDAEAQQMDPCPLTLSLVPILPHVALFPVMYIAIYMIIQLFAYSRALQRREETLLLHTSRGNAHYMLNTGIKVRMKVYYSYTYIYTWYIAKKAKGKSQEWGE